MKPISVLKSLVVADVVGLALHVVVAFSTLTTLPSPLREYAKKQAQADITATDLVVFAVAVPAMLALLVAWRGLWVQKKWAPTLYAVAWLGAGLASLGLGPTVEAASSTLMGHVGCCVSGAILGMTMLPSCYPFGAPRIDS